MGATGGSRGPRSMFSNAALVTVTDRPTLPRTPLQMAEMTANSKRQGRRSAHRAATAVAFRGAAANKR